MTDSPRDLLLAVDRAAQPRLDRLRAGVLERELAPRWSLFGWRALAAAWVLIAILRVLTPAPAVGDPESAALAQTQRLLSQDVPVVSHNFEPSDSPRIP